MAVATSTVLAAAAVAGAGASLYGGYQQSRALRAQGAAAEAAARQNAAAGMYESFLQEELIKQQANDYIAYGHRQAQQVQEQALRVRAAQTAQMVSAGVVVGTGSTQAVIDQTTALADQDALAVIYDAANKAASAKKGAQWQSTAAVNRANQMVQEGVAARIGSGYAARGAMLQGVGTAINFFASAYGRK